MKIDSILGTSTLVLAFAALTALSGCVSRTGAPESDEEAGEAQAALDCGDFEDCSGGDDPRDPSDPWNPIPPCVENCWDAHLECKSPNPYLDAACLSEYNACVGGC